MSAWGILAIAVVASFAAAVLFAFILWIIDIFQMMKNWR